MATDDYKKFISTSTRTRQAQFVGFIRKHSSWAIIFAIIVVYYCLVLSNNHNESNCIVVPSKPSSQFNLMNMLPTLIHPPPSKSIVERNFQFLYNLGEPTDARQTQMITKLLKRKRFGRFLEAGANNGIHHSNTLWLETRLKWTGILIEPDPRAAADLLASGRNAYKANICLGSGPEPTMTEFVLYDITSRSQRSDLQGQYKHLKDQKMLRKTNVPCFTLNDVLHQLNFTTLDLLSLDLQGMESDVIKSLDLSLVDIQLIQLELESKENQEFIPKYMKEIGYSKVAQINLDHFYMKN